VNAAGCELIADLLPMPVPDSQMLEDMARILRLTPEERLIEAANLSRFVSGARRV
jgi:hypothetical protein